MADVTAKLILDASGVTAGIGKAQGAMSKFAASAGSIGIAVAAGFAAAAAAATALAVGVKAAVDAGGALSELSARTGVTAGQLLVLQQAFTRAGIGAEAVGPSMNKVQKAVAEAANGSAEAQAKFANLGLSVGELSAMSPDKQFAAIGQAIGKMTDPAQQAAAAMAIFGKNGGQMLALFKDSGAMGDAAKSIGAQADLMSKNANLFDRASDILGTIGMKLQGFFVGVADKIVPQLMSVLEYLDRIDLSGIGQQLGDAIAFGLAAITSGKIGEFLVAQLKVGAIAFTNLLYSGTAGAIGGLMEFFVALPGLIGDALKLFGTVAQELVGKKDVFGKLGDLVANALIYAVAKWAAIYMASIKTTLEFFGTLWNRITDVSVKGWQEKLAATVKFLASDLVQAMTSPVAFLAKKLGGALASAASEVPEDFKFGWDSATGSFIDKAMAGANAVADGSRDRLLSAAQSLMDAMSSSGSDLMTGLGTQADALRDRLGKAFAAAQAGAGNIIDPAAAEAQLAEVKAAIRAIQEANAAAVTKAYPGTGTVIPGEDGSGDTAAKDKSRIGPLFASSLAKIGGGGGVAGAQSLLDETRRQTNYLRQIAGALRNTPSYGLA